jgi:hypothetical protein
MHFLSYSPPEYRTQIQMRIKTVEKPPVIPQPIGPGTGQVARRLKNYQKKAQW